MEIILNGHRRIAPGIRVIMLMLVSVTIGGAIVAAMLIDTLTAPALAAPLGAKCAGAVHPVLYTMEFIDAKC